MIEGEKGQAEFDINKMVEDAAGRAQDSYKYESGRKKAVDEGKISLEELGIYYFINDSVINNAGDTDLFQDKEEVKKLEQRAYELAAKGYNISEQKAQEIFEKISNLPKIYE